MDFKTNVKRASESRFRQANASFIMRKPLFFTRAAAKYAMKYITGTDVVRGVVFASSYKCNFKCSHCYAEPFTRGGDKPLSYEEKIAVIRECVDAGILAFDFVGGEIGLSEELKRLLPHCLPHRTHISLASNGYEMNRDKIRELKAAGVDKISISIDAGTPEEHDAFRNMKGSFKRCFEAIDNIRKENMTPVIITCVSRGSTRKESFKKLLDYAIHTRTELVFSAAIPFGNWAGRNDILCDDEDVAFMRTMHDQYPFLTRDCYENMGSIGCPAAKQILYISEYGDVMPCAFMHISFGNVRYESIHQIRDRMMKVPELKSYHPICLTGEDRVFIKTRLSKLYTSVYYPPVCDDVFPEKRSLFHSETAKTTVQTKLRPCPLCGSEQSEYVTSGREHEFYDTTDDLFHVVRCIRCNLVFLNPRPDDSMLNAIYPGNYYCHNKPAAHNGKSLLYCVKEFLNTRFGFPKRIAKLIRTLSVTPGSVMRILDIGCGNGNALDVFKKYARRPVDTTGLDFNARALEIVAAKGHRTIQGKLEEVPLPTGIFDIIYSSNVIEHVGDPLLMMQRAAYALKPQGVFLCETPNFDSADARWFAPSGHWGGFHFPRHWTFFTSRTFTSMAEKAGFEIAQIDYHPVPIFWIWTMHSIIYRGRGKKKLADTIFPLFEDSNNFKRSLFNKIIFSAMDIVLKCSTGKTSLMSIVMRKS